MRAVPGISTPAPAARPVPAPAAAGPAREAAPEIPNGLPKVAIAGGVYSQNPAQRMLIVDGKVFHEGAEPVPGLVLEQIRPSSVVLNFRGRRYTVSF
jgi:general secretion pathway protein B